MKISIFLISAVSLVITTAIASPLEARDAEVQDDLVNCEFRPKRFKTWADCSDDHRTHCRTGGGNCIYNPDTKRCHNNDLMRKGPVACENCSCYKRPM
ncbi:pri3a-like protein [Schizophyllum fasciatum]